MYFSFQPCKNRPLMLNSIYSPADEGGKLNDIGSFATKQGTQDLYAQAMVECALRQNDKNPTKMRSRPVEVGDPRGREAPRVDRGRPTASSARGWVAQAALRPSNKDKEKNKKRNRNCGVYPEHVTRDQAPAKSRLCDSAGSVAQRTKFGH
ncbi:hypothetical protein B0J17DRAFT_628021 [Rhizoctonia solani]|nr:hypothetical protein B0J17DRAFT_628021 [Rhizoctonia solani]